MARRTKPKLPQLLERKLSKTGQTRGADDDVIFQNRVSRANCKCKLDTRMNKNCSAQAGLDYHTASTAGAVKDAAGKAEPVP